MEEGWGFHFHFISRNIMTKGEAMMADYLGIDKRQRSDYF
jgi:hypothetical protein